MANGASTTQIREFLATLPVNKVFHLSEIMELIEIKEKTSIIIRGAMSMMAIQLRVSRWGSG